MLIEVELERARQDAKWGEQNHAPLVWLPILGEEFGEVCEALNQWNFCRDLDKAQAARKQYRTELIEVAAVAVAAVEALDRVSHGSEGS